MREVRNSKRIANNNQNGDPDNMNDNQNKPISSVITGNGKRTKKMPSNTRKIKKKTTVSHQIFIQRLSSHSIAFLMMKFFRRIISFGVMSDKVNC